MLRLPLGPSSRSRSRLFVCRLAGANSRRSAVVTRVFSSSIFDGEDDAGTSRDSAAVLRAMRNGEDVAAATADDGIDYRYRGDSKAHHDASVDNFRGQKSPLDLWGETAARTEQERQRQNDARSRNPMPSLSSLLEDEEEKEDTGDNNQRPTLSSIYNQDMGGRDMDGRRMSARKRGGPSGKREKKFVSFFDEVDNLIEKRRAEKIGTSKTRGAMSSSLANLLDKLDNYGDRPSSVGQRHSTESRLNDDFASSGERDSSGIGIGIGIGSCGKRQNHCQRPPDPAGIADAAPIVLGSAARRQEAASPIAGRADAEDPIEDEGPRRGIAGPRRRH
mmetsp:Transcript_34480/g.101322  ORF Transcript_34480/g.101322 Transcript_34480/m.101322 type:complete len:333 (-) Transcript_34480:3305-4303(-)